MMKKTATVLEGEVLDTPSTALAPAQSQALAAPAPARGAGKEDIDEDELYVPRLTLAQSTSPQTKKRDEAYVEDLEEGMFFNSVTQDVYGAGPIYFAIVGIVKRAAIFDEAGKILERDVQWGDARCKSPGEDAKGKWIKPEATRILDYVILRLDEARQPLGLIALSCKKTAYKHGKKLWSIVHATPGDLWDVLYKVEAKPESNTQFSYYVPKFSYASNKAAERQTPEEIKALCRELRAKFTKGKATVAEDTATDAAEDDVPY